MWKSEVSERLVHWRAFRIEIGGMPLPKAIQATAQLWQNCPHKSHYLTPEDPESWPNAWDLITENYYCDLAKCLGIVYTLYLSDHKASIEFEIRIYYDTESRVTYNLAWLNQGKYVLNFLDDEIVNNTSIDKKHKLLYRWTANDLNLEKY